MEEASCYGTWKIVECVSLTGSVEPTGIEGTEFTLDESGDVSWKVPEAAEPMPFFMCETYEVMPGDSAVIKFIGAFAGHVIEFKVEVSDDLMLLTYERCCMLQCQKISSADMTDEEPYSFLGALEEGYFSDLTLTAASGKEFKVHQTLLSIAVPQMDWSQSPPQLVGLPEDVLHAILHHLYSESLPRGLSEDTAKACVKAVRKLPGFSKFVQLCEQFLKNTALRQQITSLVSDMHACGDKIIDLFSGKGGEGQPFPVGESIMSNPAKLCYVVKQGLREASIAGAKLLILCDLFSRRKGELSREERHDIIKYAKSRLPVFMNQLRKFLEVCKHHCSSLTANQRYEIATYLVPEIEQAMDTICTFAVELRTALEQVISCSASGEKTEKHDRHKKGHVTDVLGKSLRNALHMRELMKLRTFYERTTQSFHNLMVKKENFGTMTQEEKIRAVAKNLEQLDEVPTLLVRIEVLMAALDEKVTWREWKYLFKLATSKVAWVLNKMQAHRPALKPLIQQACTMVHRDQFNQCLTQVQLVDPPHPPGADAAGGALPKSSQSSTKYAQLSSVESLCKPPYARDSDHAKRVVELLNNAKNTDMVFEIICVQESGDVVVDHTSSTTEEGEEAAAAEVHTHTHRDKEVDVHKIPSHCVIVASRCDWFRRALLSGMRESIDKKITVHDTNPEMFRVFLHYLYSGQFDSAELSTEQLADMITLADRYEVDCLKSLCEHSLKHHIDEDSCLFLLGLADQLHCKTLRAATLSYVIDNPSLAESDVFDDLPDHLQSEVEDLVAWHGLEARGRNLSGHSHTETPSSVSSVSEMDELMNNLDLGERREHSTSSSSDELHLMEDSERLEACISALRDIVGASVPREELVRVALAADYDANRALNFFFSS